MKKIVTTIMMLGFGVTGVLAQNTPPNVVCQDQSVTVTCAPIAGAPLTLTANVSDLQGDAVTLIWKVNDVYMQTNDLPAGTTGTPVPVTFNGSFGEGTHQVRAVASDGASLAECVTMVTVTMDGAPAITNLTATPSVLWPPNKKMRPIRLNIQATNDCGAITSRVVSVTSSEPVRGTYRFDQGPDWIIGRDGRSLQLRAERSGKSRAGRTYTITVQVTDAGGNVVDRTVTVTVPHDNSPARHPSVVKPKKGKKRR